MEDHAARGRFIAIDGIDGSGKSKVIRRIRPHFESAIVISCPNRATRSGKIIKGFLNGGMNYPRMAQIAQFEANRWEWADTVREATSQGRTVLANRWYHSGMAYALASGEAYYQAVVALTVGIPEPDLSVIIDITVEESFRRKWKPEDREALDHDPMLLGKIRQNFLDLSRKFGWVIVDGMADPDEVASRVMTVITARGAKTTP